MKTHILRFITAMQFAIISCSIIWEYSTQKYMTAMRIALYQNRSLESAYPMGVISDTAALLMLLAAFILISIALVGRFINKLPTPSTKMQIRIFAAAALSLLSALFMLFSGIDILRTYYAMSAAFISASLLQIIKCALTPD